MITNRQRIDFRNKSIKDVSLVIRVGSSINWDNWNVCKAFSRRVVWHSENMKITYENYNLNPSLHKYIIKLIVNTCKRIFKNVKTFNCRIGRQYHAVTRKALEFGFWCSMLSFQVRAFLNLCDVWILLIYE
jgi:hypothetical protein